MNSVEFEATMSQGGEIVLPAQFLGEIPAGQQLKVVVMWESGSADAAWRAVGRLRFEEAYSPEDVIYDQLINETPGRWSRVDPHAVPAGSGREDSAGAIAEGFERRGFHRSADHVPAE